MPLEMPSRFCCDEDLARIGYDGQNAAVDLEAWRRDGPRPTTRELVDVLTAEGVGGAVVLDIGAGVGAVHVVLLEAGAARALDVDASREYQAAARAEAERRGLAGRVEYRYGDIVELADGLPPADIVTADAYPHEAWWMRIGMRVYNLISALRHRPEHWFIHRRREIDRLHGWRWIPRDSSWWAVVWEGGCLPPRRVTGTARRILEGILDPGRAHPSGADQHRLRRRTRDHPSIPTRSFGCARDAARGRQFVSVLRPHQTGHS